jgi:NADH-quinone oxidoreductase subunit H
MATKEDVLPARAEKILFNLGPVLAFAPVVALFAIVPAGPALPANQIPGFSGTFGVSLQVIPHLDVGVLYVFAFASLAVYGAALGGWASNNKLSLLGGVRASSQMIAYEVALGLSLVGAMMAFGTLRLEQMAVEQGAPLFGGVLPAWGIFLQPLGFLLFFAAAFAETKRAPFDLPEAESEIVGYFLEYSGMRFGLYMFGEFIEIVVLSGIIAAVFLGGWHLPDVPALGLEAAIRNAAGPFALAALQAGFFMAKVVVLCWLQMTIRWTLPRFRYDQIQGLGWKVLLPLGLVNVFVTGVAVLVDPTLNVLAAIGLVEWALLIGVTVLYRPAAPASVRARVAPAAADHHAHH